MVLLLQFVFPFFFPGCQYFKFDKEICCGSTRVQNVPLIVVVVMPLFHAQVAIGGNSTLKKAQQERRL